MRPLNVSLNLWKSAIEAMLRGDASKLLQRWPGPEYLCRADARDVQTMTRLSRNKARQLIRFSSMYLGSWTDIRQLPGVSERVARLVQHWLEPSAVQCDEILGKRHYTDALEN